MCVTAACLGLALLGSDARPPQISDVILAGTGSSNPPHGHHQARVQGSGLKVLVPVPAVARSGDTLEVAVPGHRSREVQVPAGFKPGQVLSFVIPTKLGTGMESSAKQILADSGVKATLAKLASTGGAAPTSQLMRLHGCFTPQLSCNRYPCDLLAVVAR